MSMDPTVEPAIKEFLKKPRREQLDEVVIARVLGSAPIDRPWLSQGMAEGLMMRILIESSHRLEGLTRWLVGLTCGLIALTIVLAILTGVLAYGEVQRLIGNFGSAGSGPG